MMGPIDRKLKQIFFLHLVKRKKKKKMSFLAFSFNSLKYCFETSLESLTSSMKVFFAFLTVHEKCPQMSLHKLCKLCCC